MCYIFTYSTDSLGSPHTCMQRWSLSLCICANGSATGKGRGGRVTVDCSSRMFSNELLDGTLVALPFQKGLLAFLVATHIHPSSFRNNNAGKPNVILFHFYPFSSLEAWYSPPPPSPSPCSLHLLPAFMVMRAVRSLLNTQATAGPLVKLQPRVLLPPTTSA